MNFPYYKDLRQQQRKVAQQQRRLTEFPLEIVRLAIISQINKQNLI